LGCYGVLLNVSVHPFEEDLVDNLYKYPRIVDFEPKLRDFYQAASETGEILTSSMNTVSTTRSFGSTDATQSSWQAGATANLDPKAVQAATGVPVGIGINGSTSQVRTETDQQNWGVATDASRERREGKSTTTQLSQMYNLLTGYHTGTNRAAFLMLPRPHILQPTDRRSFVQGLRFIEGVQDFFLVVVRPKDQDKMKVDAFLQTGHFPENIEIEETVPVKDQFEFKSVTVKTFTKRCLGQGLLEGVVGTLHDAVGGEPSYIETKVTEGLQTFDGFESDGWEFDPNEGDSGHKSVTEKEQDGDNIDDFDGVSFIKHTYKAVSPDQVQIEISVKNKTMWPDEAASKAKFDRKYKVFLRRRKNIEVSKVANVAGLLITQRSLCTRIKFGDCITRIPPKKLIPDDFGIVFEAPFDITDLYDVPIQINVDAVAGKIHDNPPRADFAFKKAIIRKIQSSMLAAYSSPFRYPDAGLSFIESRHFRSKLLRALPRELLDKPAFEVDLLRAEIRDAMPKEILLRDLLSGDETKLRKYLAASRREIMGLKFSLFGSGPSRDERSSDRQSDDADIEDERGSEY
jgi:hypothetical protein